MKEKTQDKLPIWEMKEGIALGILQTWKNIKEHDEKSYNKTNNLS